MNNQSTQQNTDQEHTKKILKPVYLQTKSGSVIMDEPMGNAAYRKRYFVKIVVPRNNLDPEKIVLIGNAQYLETHNRVVTLPVNVDHKRFETLDKLFAHLTQTSGYRPM